MQAHGSGPEDIRLHRAGAATHQDERGEQAGDSAACGHIVEALEGALDIGLLSTWPSFEELRLEPREAVQDHRFDEPFAAAEMMQNSGMGQAHVGGDFLQADCFGPAADQAALGGIENCAPCFNQGAARAWLIP